MSSRIPASLKLWQRAQELIPGGTQLVSRRPTRAAFGVSPIYASRARGARIWDVDGHEYVDWISGFGAIILGYADPIVDEAVARQIELGVGYSLNHELEIELAEELARRIPCAQMVRYCKGGGEACAIAVRIARGATGRDKVLVCGYHGWHDWYLAANLDAEIALDEHLFSGIEPIGVPRALAGTTIPFPYGDLTALANKLDQLRGKVACVIMEPLRSELPPPGYLQGVARLCREHGVVLIFDEITTGFRLHENGVEAYFGVTPDMAVFAKSISNGYPFGAVVGRREVMEQAARMFISSTSWSDTIGLRAALSTLREIERRSVPRALHAVGSKLQRRLSAAAKECGVPILCDGLIVHPRLTFEIADEKLRRDAALLYIQEMAKRGCHGFTSFYLNLCHGIGEIDDTVIGATEAFRAIRRGLDKGDFGSLLECQPQQEFFRRLVQ
ncbi:MAG: aminotransferase class III-fold pyridoxal phosphate-dependent enzyme [Pirellulales bacterium]